MDPVLFNWLEAELDRRDDEDSRIAANPYVRAALKRDRDLRRRGIHHAVANAAPIHLTKRECFELLDEVRDIIKRARAAA